MNKDSIIDYCGYILFRILGPLIRSLPLGMSMFLGRALGELLYHLDFKHKAVAYSNIKTAFRNKLSPSQISNLTRDFYRRLAQNVIEVFLIPLVNKEYINKYINIEGLDYNIVEGFKRGKGVILLGVHAGSWELSGVICVSMGFPFSLFIRDQRHPRLDRLLNAYRSQKGCKLIQRQSQMRRLIQALKNNEAVGMTVDQGGKSGTLVEFFGKEASMASGAVRLALKYDATIIPVFYTRIKGPYIKVIISQPVKIKRTGNRVKDIHDNLQELVHLVQDYILQYPQEYLWSYKIYKYTKERNILILSDGKTGHLRQAEAAAGIVKGYFKDKRIIANIDILEVSFKNKFSRNALALTSVLSGKYNCQGCLWCLKTFLKKNSYNTLISFKPDVVISCGSSVAPVSYVISRESLAKSIVIMRPSILSTQRFDLVIMPRHDRPPRRKNVLVTEGALNLIDDEYLREQSARLRQLSALSSQLSALCIGLLIGGDTQSFSLKEEAVLEVVKQIKSLSEKWNADILITTSRRTRREIELLLKKEFKDYPYCKLLVIANEKNIPEVVGGILGLSKVLVISPESISMVSEAVNSRKYVLVFDDSLGLGRRHRAFIKHFAENKYIYTTKTGELNKTIEYLWLNKPKIIILRDNYIIREAIKRIL